MEIMDQELIFTQIFEEIGPPRNYGKSAEQLAQEEMEQEKKRVYQH